MNISIIGGDLRMIRLAQLYAKEKSRVYTYGLEKYFLQQKIYSVILCNTMQEAVNASEIVISSMPFSKDGLHVNAPFAEKYIKVEELKNSILHQTFIAGGIPEDFYQEGRNNLDLLQMEELTILNAILTVEGTIKIVIEEREESLFESNVLVCGFGRIGKILCDRLQAFGTNVFCVARKTSDLVWIRERGYNPLTYDKIPTLGKKFDLVINTVPTLVLKEKELDALKEEILIIDVASNPGGINKEYAEKKNIKVITALGIPGKEMPTTAAKFVKEVIEKNYRSL